METLGESLTAAREAEAEEFIVENDVMAVLFSTRGGQIKGVTLKDYTQYGPRGKRDRKIEMMDPATARFGLSFYLKNVPVNTLDYVFTAQPVVGEADGAKSVVMRLPVAERAYLEYRYLIYDTEAPERDYLVDFDVRLVNMAPEMANQTQIQIDWANTTFQNEKGFQNENMYTTLSYRFPDETSIEELGMSEGAKSKNISTQVNWVAFKQQFFSSVFIAPDNVPTPTSPSTRRLPSRRCSRPSRRRWACPIRRRPKGMTSHSISAPTSTRSSRRSGSRAVRIFIWSVSCRWAGASSDGSTAGA